MDITSVTKLYQVSRRGFSVRKSVVGLASSKNFVHGDNSSVLHRKILTNVK